MPQRCRGCHNTFSHLLQHQKTCIAYHKVVEDALHQNRSRPAASQQSTAPPRKRSRTNLAGQDEIVQPNASQSMDVDVSEESSRSAAAQMFASAGFEMPKPASEEPVPTVHPPTTTRAGREVHATWKVRDQLPEAPGIAHDDDNRQPAPTEPSRGQRVRLLLTERIRTAANRFGLSRLYKRRPVLPPDTSIDLEAVYAPTAQQKTPKRSPRTIRQIIAPHPNLTSFLFNYHHWVSGSKKTMDNRDALQALLTHPEFNAVDLTGVNFRKVDAELASSTVDAPWARDGDGWKHESVTINVPPLGRPSLASQRAAAAEQRRAMRAEDIEVEPAATPLEGVPVTIPGLWYKDICVEIRRTLEEDDAAKAFIFDPHLLFHSRPGTDEPPEAVYCELFNSQAAVDADIRLGPLIPPDEPGCNLPKAIAMTMWWTDATHVTQFGNSKVWPGYMSYGNETKYTASRPSCHSTRQMVFFPSLDGAIQETIRARLGKGASPAVMTHLRRELFHAAWGKVLNNDFIHAYRHGMVVDCKDGVRRRIYPRIFTYSADYPEKMLIAALRDKGQHPCPHCLVTFKEIPQVGTEEDRRVRIESARKDDGVRNSLVDEARRLIYGQGYSVTSDKVEDLLKAISAVPTVNIFSKLLREFGLDVFAMLVPDVLHEFELGVWKALFSHLIRMLYALGEDKVQELDTRYRQVAPFGRTTIRRFVNNASEMHQIGARDFEDLLQCAIPCFEGLFPEPDNTHVMRLLYTMAYWHSLAKMRMHTESSVCLLDNAHTAMATHLRHFEKIVCPRYTTKETQKEYAKRVRTETKRTTKTTVETNTRATGRKTKSFNLSTVKTHLLGYYPSYIRTYGTMDLLSTLRGEQAHRHVKARRGRTNGRRAEAQMGKIDIRETRLRHMAEELHEIGVPIPDYKGKSKDTSIPAGPTLHHWIAQDSDRRIALDISLFQHQHDDGDPAIKDFRSKLREHLRHWLWSETNNSPADPLSHPDALRIKDDRLYSHATAQVNYTTYDVQRGVDILHCSNLSETRNVVKPSAPEHHYGFSLDKSAVLVHSVGQSSGLPWAYAIVLGIFHAFVLLPDGNERRLEFLWVRWLDRDLSLPAGPTPRRLERLTLAPLDAPNAVDFIDPASVIRGCHLIPAFHHGRLPHEVFSLAHHSLGDWRFLYVNRFVDRDMFARHTGMSVGSLDMQAAEKESIGEDEDLLNEIARCTTSSASTDSVASLSAPNQESSYLAQDGHTLLPCTKLSDASDADLGNSDTAESDSGLDSETSADDLDTDSEGDF